MKKLYLLLLATLLLFPFTNSVEAQRGIIKRKIKKDMKEKHAEPEKEKGRDAVKDVTYENDTRYPVPENRVQATIAIKNSTFRRNGKLKNATNSKMVFGKTGECMVTNEGEKDESRMIFDYKGAAIYVVDMKEKSATKMPMINFQSFVEKMAEGKVDLDDSNGEWNRTDQQEKINGYSCRKYIYTDTKKKTKTDVWITQDFSIDLSGNHLFGGQIRDFSSNPVVTQPSKGNKNIPKGVIVRTIQYRKNSDKPSSQMEIITFKKSSDSNYFDLNDYEIHDVLDDM